MRRGEDLHQRHRPLPSLRERGRFPDRIPAPELPIPAARATRTPGKADWAVRQSCPRLRAPPSSKSRKGHCPARAAHWRPMCASEFCGRRVQETEGPSKDAGSDLLISPDVPRTPPFKPRTRCCIAQSRDELRFLISASSGGGLGTADRDGALPSMASTASKRLFSRDAHAARNLVASSLQQPPTNTSHPSTPRR